MTKQDAVSIVDKISDIKNSDDQGKHCIEDAMYIKFVECIANEQYKTIEEVIEIAKEVIKSRDIEYSRYYS